MGQTALHIDFETRSTVDLPKTTTDVYAKHPTTDVWCMAFAFGDGGVRLWAPDKAPVTYQSVIDYVKKGGLVIAHNVAFELAIWNHILVPRYGFPPLEVEQCRCTMAMAYAMSLPGALDKAAAALGIDQRKDAKGGRLMIQMAKPRRIEPDGTPIWWDDAERLERLYAYCKQDVEVERELHRRLLPLSAAEQKLWFVDRAINQRGVQIDIPAAERAIGTVEAERKRLDAEMRRVTGGQVTACTNTNQLTDFLREQGVETGGVSKADLGLLIERHRHGERLREAGDPEPDTPLPAALPAPALEAIELRQEAAKSSTAKLSTMIRCASEDGRVRETLQYHGAGPGRWSGRKIQVQNYPRPQLDQWEIEDAIEHIDDPAYLSMMFGAPMDVVASCLRAFIVAAPGHDLVAADYSNIEGRGLAWLAGEDWKLDAFREADAGTGPEIYKLTAAGILGKSPRDIDKNERQAFGKVPELALGYQGGVGAFDSMARIYGVNMAEHYDTVMATASPEHREEAEVAYAQRGRGDRRRWIASEVVKLGWRARHSAIVQYWRDLEDAAIAAVQHPGGIYSAGPAGREIRFRKAGSFLFAQLPSKRCICYPYPVVVEKKTPWKDARGNPVMKPALRYKGVDPLTRKWTEIDTYGGKLSQNMTEGICRDVLAEALYRFHGTHYSVVMHVHDEIVAEVPEGVGSVEEMERLMAIVPGWARGLPVAVEGYRGKRYRK